MRRFNILFAFAAILFTSCVVDDVDFTGSYNPSSKGGIHIVGAVEDFDVKTVGTRADDGDIADSYISEMTMFIFKGNGDLVQGYKDASFSTECTSAINIQRGNPTFLIDTEEGILADLSGTSDTNIVYYNNNANDLGACNIYIVANAWHQLSAVEGGSRPVDSIKTLADLEAFVYKADGTLAMPMVDNDTYRGFPMIGKQQGGSFKLKKGDDNEGNAVATIPLKKLYSKVRFTMQINADQVVAGQTPKFTITKAEVFNVPKMAHLGRELDVNGKPVYGTTNEDDYVDDYVTEMGVTGTYTPSDYYHFTSEPYTINTFVGNKKTIYHSTSLTTDDIIEFSFYMPEHKVTPNTIKYPDNITDEAKQYYKPAGVGQSRNGDGSISPAKIATFVRIHGSYTDHNGQILGVKYDIYLGQNNFDDFTIKRNQQLNNKLIITGLTNHKDAYPDTEGNISIDHRVEIEDKGFNLSMERTAILDAHFEVRPLDIELQANSSMTITIPKEYRSWIAMEDDAAARSSVNSGLYVNTSTPRKGVRKYFTTNLVSDLNTAIEKDNNKDVSITISNKEATTDTFRIWFYIDENPNVYDKLDLGKQTSETGTYTVSKEQYRVCPVKFEYKGSKIDENGNTVDVTNDATINFQQWNLWRVWSADGNRYYDIEHEEEYLNNYASDAQYGQTQNGMPWGLEGIQLSTRYQAAYVNSDSSGILSWILGLFGGNFSSWVNTMITESNISPFYDFYLTRDNPINNITPRDHQGLTFNKEIATTLKALQTSTDSKVTAAMKASAKIDGILLNEDPKSAFAYCYHKNKRDSNGQVVEQKWFLPAIDEIEDIAKGAYDEFDKVLQGHEYWSCQPAFTKNTVTVNINILFVISGSTSGSYYEDDMNRARATKIEYNPQTRDYDNISSGVDGNTNVLAIKNKSVLDSSLQYSDPTPTGDKITYHAGNNSRTTDIGRIRAVYRSGTK